MHRGGALEGAVGEQVAKCTSRLCDDPITNGADCAGFLGHLQELRRSQQSALWMIPAQQCLDGNDATGVQGNYWLICHLKFVAGQRTFELRGQGEAITCLRAHGLAVHLAASLATLFGAVHRRVGIHQQGESGIGG